MQKNEAVTTAPEVILGNYKGLKAKRDVFPVTDDAIEAELSKILSQNAQKCDVTGRAIETGDIATLDFEGFVDGVAFEGGKGENVDLEIGSNTFIPGFEEQLLGRNSGEAFDIIVHFPEGYGGPNLSGKEATFKIDVHSISTKSVPQPTDEIAQNIAGVSTIAEFRELIRQKIEETANANAEQQVLDSLLRQVVDSSSFVVSEDLIKTETESMAAEYSQHLQSRGIKLEQYLEMAGQSMDQFLDSMKEPAAMRVKSTLALKAIAGLEGISASQEEMEKEFDTIASMYNIPVADLKNRFREEDLLYIKAIIINKKLFAMLLDVSVIE
jgi:trigger factor